MVGPVLLVLGGLPGDHVPAETGQGNDGDHVDEVERGQHDQGDQPEPQSDVDLLVDDVQAEDADGVFLHNGS